MCVCDQAQIRLKAMKKLFSPRRNLRASILTAFTLLLFLSFALTGLAFNLTINQYIRTSATSVLQEARANPDILQGYIGEMRMLQNPSLRSSPMGIFHQNLHFFDIDVNYRPIFYEYVTQAAVDISEALARYSINLHQMEIIRIHVAGHVYFVAPAGWVLDYPVYTIFYVDVTELERFVANVNLRLLVLVAFIWLLAMVVTTILAGSLAKPLRTLSVFVRQIGQGDFTPNPISFTNEEFEELNRNLNHTAKQLSRYDNDQRAFFQNVSHELRTPLMSIKSYAEGIKYAVMSPDKASEVILDATDRLADMVDDILYVSRIDNITMPKTTEANLVIMIEERIRVQEAIAEKKGLKINFVCDKELIIIPCVVKYIERAIDNLISNAIRYAKNTIIVECFTIGAKATVRVIDDGPGFEAESLPYVFERFFKGKNGLTGIGLSIVKSVIEQHKGTATAENGDKGAVLTISLPRTTK